MNEMRAAMGRRGAELAVDHEHHSGEHPSGRRAGTEGERARPTATAGARP